MPILPHVGSSWISAFGVDSTTAKSKRAYQPRNVLLRAVRQVESCGNLSLKRSCSFEVAQHPGYFSGGSPWCRIWVLDTCKHKVIYPFAMPEVAASLEMARKDLQLC